MKVIVISGASSEVGKTTLAGKLRRLLPGAEVVKIGHGRRKPSLANHFYESGTSFQTIREKHAGAAWLIIESNSILHEIEPDLVIYLEGEHPKPSARYARGRADIISGRLISDDALAALAAKLEIPAELVRQITFQAGVRCAAP
jgi:deoxyadenosine/deoxycytidine kinase